MSVDSKWIGGLAREAGELTLRYFRNNVAPRDKGSRLGFVTEADLASEKLIREKIRAHSPGHSILGEEAGLEETQATGPIWIVDPLDGTNNFSKGNSFYCISIAYAERTPSGCKVLAGAIYRPTTNELFLADRGKGAFLNGAPLKMAELPFEEGSYATGFGSAHGDELRRILDRVLRVQEACSSTAVRINGAAALEMACTSQGVFQGFWEPNLNAWDSAAGALLVEEAGGTVTNFSGQAFEPLRDRSVVCATRALHPKLLKLLQR